MLVTKDTHPCFICGDLPKVIDYKLSASLGITVFRDICVRCLLEKFDDLIDYKMKKEREP